MMKRCFRIKHNTLYEYSRPVTFGPHRLLLHPVGGDGVEVLSASVEISPNSEVSWSTDPYGNRVGHATFRDRGDHLLFESNLVVIQDGSKEIPQSITFEDLASNPEVPDWTSPTAASPSVHRWALKFIGPTVRETVQDMVSWVYREMDYLRRLEEGTYTPSDTLRRRRGACRDFAVLVISGCRSIGIPARFASGYLYDPSREGVTEDSSGFLHGWAQVHVPGAGWCDLDPTHGRVGSQNLIRVSVGPGPGALAPVSGTWVGFSGDSLGMAATISVSHIPGESLQGAA